MTRLGFIGIGLMGEAMVRRLLESGHRSIRVWNLEPERLELVVPHGAIAAASPAEVAATCDVVMTCVLNTEAVRSVLFGEQGIASAGQLDGRLLIDLSTADPDATRAMASDLADRTGMGWVDAPVSGGPEAARAGRLAIMAGGDVTYFNRAKPLLASLAANLTHMGPVGAGQVTKVINQAIVGTGFVLMAEAIALAERTGIDAAALPACLAGGLADSELLRRIYPKMQQRQFEPPIGYARQLLKDMQAVREFAQSRSSSLPLVEAAVRQYERFVDQGNSMADSASVIRLYRPDS